MAFPTVALLDSFIRLETPTLSNGGKWQSLYESGENKGNCNGEEWETSSGATKEGAYWHPTTFKEPGVALEFTFAKSINVGNYLVAMDLC